MPPVINYSDQTIAKSSTALLQPNGIYNAVPDEVYLSSLWEKACLGNTGAFETIHYLLYPLLFNYAYIILKDDTATDTILADIFICFWFKKSSVQFGSIKTYLVKQVRISALKCLADAESSCNKGSQSVKLLTFLNSSGFRERETCFLRDYLKTSEKEIIEIMNK